MTRLVHFFINESFKLNRRGFVGIEILVEKQSRKNIS